jgi:DNA polymerase-1
MNVLAWDTETTTHSKGHPFDPRNKLVCWSYAYDDVATAVQWPDKHNCWELLEQANLMVGFNFKFDLQWIVKEGITYNPTKVWDVQIAEYILSHFTHMYPSLNEVCEKYGLPSKLDVIKLEYWDKGIQTDDIPWEILKEYATLDASLTLQCYYKQIETMSKAQITLCKLMSQDLSILREMEANGLPFDEHLCQVRAKELDEKISTINQDLSSFYPGIPIKFSSNDHLSAFLYGGVVKEDSKEFVGFFKTGVKAGQPKFKNIVIEHTLPRLYTPLKGSEMAKEGNYAVDEGTLRKLKGKASVVSKLLELAKMEKLNGTYYKGLIKLRELMHWPKGLLHGNFSQTGTRTGRLSSQKPNLQNMASDIQEVFVSKYND